MYLKSLVLKGFKSFADRSVLALEPGLTVIVGPNGSGKSNISDAILWALGEQSAKQLRGQAMEDVIFSGSSARSAVGVAEVDIVLDNSDGTLPIDFEEVAFTRRMYRNGESEYLINGSPALLRDILDILHDSGLGRETHSIISQGSLSSVLRSRPEDRRALIEEAAGVLKHRKRKERASRKLDAMDVSLDRIRDVSREIERQLRPLEKQAKAAQQYADLSEELKDLEMQLSVDDLRGLQAVWGDADKREKEAAAEVELFRYRHTEKENELSKYQKMLEEQGLFVGDIAEQRRRCQSIIERLDSNMLLLEEKGNNMVARVSDLRSKIHTSSAQLADAKTERDALSAELVENNATIQELSRSLAELGRKSEALRKARKEADDEYTRLSAELRGKERAIEDAKSRIEKSEQSIASLHVEDDMLSRRFDQIDEQHAVATNALAARRSRFDELQALADKTGRDLELARLDTDKRVRLLEQRRNELSKQRESYNAISAEMQGLREVDRAFETASPALSWVIAHESEYGNQMKPISDLFKAPAEYQLLVERLLGADIFGLMVDDAESAGLIAERLLSDTKGEGGISFVPADRARAISRSRAATGMRLLDQIEYPLDCASVAEALLGDVYIVDTIPQAVAASKADETGARFATRDAAVVWPSGKITLGVQTNDVEGVLARRQRLGALEDDLSAATAALSDAEMEVSEAENALKLAQQDGFELAQQEAAYSGELDSLRSEISRLEQSLTQVAAEREHIQEQRHTLADRVEASQPLIAESQQRIESLQVEVDALTEAIAAGSDDRASRASAESEVREAIGKTNVDIATTSTRELYIRQRITALESEVATLEHAIAVSYDTQASLDVLSRRVEPLYNTFEELSVGIKEWANKLRDQALFEQSNSSSLAEAINTARAEVTAAKEELDAKTAALSDARVEKGKVEAQVDAAVNNIVETNGIMLETALETPLLENRNAAEDRAIKLRRRIAGIGLVNQVARQEYEDLKARSEYIKGQVADLEEARKALSKIVAAIDRKMRNQFLVTFEEVDKNFQEVFAGLFPGGSAHLSLTDPDHPEATGVEVHAQPRGKKITKMSLMSGGEMSLTALALLFAVYRTRTVPFYVLDEVDDALDDTNLRRLVTCIDSMRHETQFLIITHARRTMEMADVLYGVSMQADGVSKVVSQKLDRSASGLSPDATPEELQAAIDSGEVERTLEAVPAKPAAAHLSSAARRNARR